MKIITLYHFTCPCYLPKIFSTGGLEPRATPPHDFMSGGVPVVWLTTDPRGNKLRRADVRHFKKLGLVELLHEIEGGGRKLMFGADRADGGGCARIALQLPKQAQRDGVLVPYLRFVRAEMGLKVWRHFRSHLTDHADDWWLAFAAIPVDLFAAVDPVGEPSPGYVTAVKKIRRSKRRRAQCVIAEAHAS